MKEIWTYLASDSQAPRTKTNIRQTLRNECGKITIGYHLTTDKTKSIPDTPVYRLQLTFQLSRSCNMSTIIYYIVAGYFSVVASFNLDVENAIVRRGNPDSYFGYSLAVYQYQNQSWYVQF